MDIIAEYEKLIAIQIDEEGIRVPHVLVAQPDDKLVMMALLDVPPHEAYSLVYSAIVEQRATKAIFALDRFARMGQGTTLGDLMAGHYFSNGEFKPFIIEYQHEPRIVKPIDWENDFWNSVLRSELQHIVKAPLGANLQ